MDADLQGFKRYANVSPAGAKDEAAIAGNVRGEGGGAEDSVALDQWRGLALVLVLISHGFFFTGRVAGIGRVGVNLFFFISGVLVFRSLSRSKAPDLSTKARSFWKRRGLRLYPALVGYVLLGIPLAYLFEHRPDIAPNSSFADYLRDLPRGVGYLMNYSEKHHLGLGHLWSLATEVQFYFLGPFIFWLGGANPSRRRWVWGGLLAFLMVLGGLQPRFGENVKYHFEFSVWPMMLGFASEWGRPQLEPWARRLLKPALTLAALSLFGSCLVMLFGLHVKVIVVAIGTFMVPACYCAYVSSYSVPGRAGFLLTWLGQRTYSIYLWQQPLTICGYLPPRLHPLGAIASCFVGALFFNVLERPFLRRKSVRLAAGTALGGGGASASG